MDNYYDYNYGEVNPKDKGNSVDWDSMKKGFFDDREKRTKDLVNKMDNSTIGFTQTSVLSPCHHIKYQTNDVGSGSSFTNEDIPGITNNAIDVLRKNPKMLEYKFRSDKTLEVILVHSNVDLLQQFSTSDEDICTSACNVYAAIQLFIDNLSKYDQSKTTVPIRKPYVILTDKLSSKCRFGNIEQSYGGSKSRRGRTRKSKAKAKSKTKAKTHRRRRHSHVRKHKKNTYTRRR
jgi:hypothetical protein